MVGRAPEEPWHLIPGTFIVVMTRLRTVSRPNPKETGEISDKRQRNRDLRCKRPSDPETKVVEPVVGGEPVAVRRAKEDRSEEPGPAAHDTATICQHEEAAR